MTKRKRLFAIVGGSILGLLLVVLAALVIVLQSSWFAGFARTKLAATIEDSVGGKVDIGSFEFDLWHLTIHIRNFVLHGTETPPDAPLAQVDLLEVRVKLFSGIAHLVDLAYVGIESPKVNVIVRPDGTTNIPEPPKPKQPSSGNGLETLVNLKIGSFQIQKGLLAYAQRKTAFSGRGENLRALLQYRDNVPSYQGSLFIDPLVIESGQNPPLAVHVTVPLVIEQNAVRLNAASLVTDHSRLALTASLQGLNAPVIDGQVQGDVFLPEMQRSFGLPIDVTSRGLPQHLTLQLQAHSDDRTKVVRLQQANLTLGRTRLSASGAVREPNNPNSTIHLDGSFALDEIGRMMKLSPTELSGTLGLQGLATLDQQNNYKVDGVIESHNLALQSGDLHVPGLQLHLPFHADPFLVSVDGLRFDALGGSLRAKLFLQNSRSLSAEGNLNNFSLPVLASVLTGKRLGYSGVLGGSLMAKGDLQEQGTRGYSANAHLLVSPGGAGVPVRGKIDASYDGRADSIRLGESFLALPNTTLDLSGAINQALTLKLVSHNLNDFLPAVNFGAAQPQTALPVVLLQGGTASIDAMVSGQMANPHLAATAALDRFAAEGRSFDHLGLRADASRDHLTVTDGALQRPTLSAKFDAALGLRKWSPVPASPVHVNLTLDDSNLGDLLSLAGQDPANASGRGRADVHVLGTYANPVGTVSFVANDGTVYGQPFQTVNLQTRLADQLITLDPLEVRTAAGSVTVQGRFQHPEDSFSTGQMQVRIHSTPIQMAQIEKVKAQKNEMGGVVQLSADLSGSLRQVNGQSAFDVGGINADLSARALKLNNQEAGDLTLTASTQNKTVSYRVHSNLAGSDIAVDGHTDLSPNYPTAATASIQKLAISKVLSLTGQTDIPAAGDLSASATVNGTMNAPDAHLTFALAHANVYGEAIQALNGTVDYLNTLVDIPSIQLQTPAGSLNLKGSYRHAPNDLQTGDLNLDLSTTDIQVSQIAHVRQVEPTLSGTLHMAAGVSAALHSANGKQQVAFSRLNADVSAQSLEMNGRSLGRAAFTAKSNSSTVHYQFDSNLADSVVHASGNSTLSGDYPTQASLTFKNIRYKNIAPFLSQETDGGGPTFDALVEGAASVNGPMFNTNALHARLQLDRLEAQASPFRSPTGGPAGKPVNIQNQGPIVVAMNGQNVTVDQFRLEGGNTRMSISGGVSFANQTSPIDLTVGAQLDLAALGDVDRSVYSSGNVNVDAVVRGTFGQPLVNGQITLKNANVNYASLPNGLTNANGVIRLNGTSASIENLTAESGGGKITLTGFAGLSGQSGNFNLKAAAKNVRVRYSGISVSSDAAIALVGNTRRSLVTGNVTIDRIAYNSSSDAGSLLSTFASTPPSSPTAPSPILTGMRLNIAIATAPDLRVATTYADRLSIEARLTVRGTAANPGLLGRISVTDGKLVFFGNTYTVNTGTINFYNPTSIQPNINVSLQTLAQGVDVTLGVSGPMENLQLSYRSDPPLTFEQIVQLLATNTTPNDPNIVANQPPSPQQSFTQMGESAILGQAVANPLASRVQRVFGLSQFKIDPSVSGSNGQPSARVTLQEKIANNITFSYITDVTQTNNQIIRVQWDLTPKFSAVGLRDYNGNVSIQFFYGFKKR